MELILPLKVALSAFVLLILLRRLMRNTRRYASYENYRAMAGLLVLTIGFSIIWAFWY